MRHRFNTVLAVGAVMAVAAFASSSAEALPVRAGLNAAIQQANPVQEVVYNCRRVWRCGYWGCGWRRACWWGPGYRYGYGYGYGHGYRPYRWGWRHHHW